MKYFGRAKGKQEENWNVRFGVEKEEGQRKEKEAERKSEVGWEESSDRTL